MRNQLAASIISTQENCAKLFPLFSQGHSPTPNTKKKLLFVQFIFFFSCTFHSNLLALLRRQKKWCCIYHFACQNSKQQRLGKLLNLLFFFFRRLESFRFHFNPKHVAVFFFLLSFAFAFSREDFRKLS